MIRVLAPLLLAWLPGTGAAAQAAPAAPVAPATAQDAATPAPVMLDRIQVTATRTPRDPLEVPASVTVVDVARAARDRPGTTLAELLVGVPGVLARDRHNAAQDEQISIRGFGTRASFGIRGVRLLVDGVPATMPDGQGQVSLFPLDTAERIEVLRGPFSALYGNAAGGVVQLFTPEGSAPARTTLAAGVGGSTARQLALDTRGAGEAWHWLAGTRHVAGTGWRAHSAFERTQANLRLDRHGPADTLTLLVNAIHSQAQDPQGLDRAQFLADPRSASEGALAFDTRKSLAQQQLALVHTRALAGGGEWRAMVYGGQRAIRQVLSIPVGTQRSPLSGGGVIDLRAPYAGLDLRWSGQASLAGRTLDWTLGASLDRQRQDRQGYENFVGDVLGVPGALRLDQDDRVSAFDQYAQATWAVGDTWSLMAGARHSTVRFVSRDRYVTTRNPDDSGRVRHAATTPVLGAGWTPAPHWRVYAAWGEGFETPTFNELGYRSDGGSGLNLALRPARTRSIELGAKFARGARRAELAVFRAETRDELTVATSAGGRTTYQNAGHARRRGLEGTWQAPLGAQWRGALALTWIDARFRDGFLACAGVPCPRPDTPVAPATRIPGVPRGSASLALERGGDQGWRLRIDGRAVDAVPANSIDGERVPGHAVLGASLGYGVQREGLAGRAWIAVDNLADRRHAGSVIVNEGNRRYYEPAPGRTLSVGIELRWQ